MKKWLKIALIVLGLLPVIIFNPFGRCRTVFVYTPSLFTLVFFYIFYLTVLIIYINRHISKKLNSGIKPIILYGIFIGLIHFFSYHIYLGTFNQTQKELASFHSNIDRTSYHKYYVILYENGKYKIKKETQFGYCYNYGIYKQDKDTIRFDEDIVNFSMNRLGNKYYITQDSLLPLNEKDDYVRMFN